LLSGFADLTICVAKGATIEDIQIEGRARRLRVIAAERGYASSFFQSGLPGNP
jgi:hypothetical protein